MNGRICQRQRWPAGREIPGISHDGAPNPRTGDAVRRTPALLRPAPTMEKDKPFKELRFTRSHQAITFLIAGIVFFCITAALVSLRWWGTGGGSLWWALLPLIGAWVSFRLAARLARHAYLLLSPIGIEIFPFFRPDRYLQLVSWGEIKDAAVSPDQRLLTLSLAGYEDSKIIISLDPVKPAARGLLAKAVSGVMEKCARAAAESHPAAPEGPPEPDGTEQPAGAADSS